MKKQLAKLIFTLSITLVLFLGLSSALNYQNSADWRFRTFSSYNSQKPSLDLRTSGEKYYYSYAKNDNPSLWRNQRVFNAEDYPSSNTSQQYTKNYYYKPRFDSLNDHYQWRF